MCEAASGLGLMLGPVMGSLIYSRLGFMNTFLIFSFILTINCLIILVTLPQSLNKNPYEDTN
jgi:predicted MFS family arabinose efflux permease